MIGPQSAPADTGKAKPRPEAPATAKPAPFPALTDPTVEKQKPKAKPLVPLGEPKLKRRKNP